MKILMELIVALFDVNAGVWDMKRKTAYRVYFVDTESVLPGRSFLLSAIQL